MSETLTRAQAEWMSRPADQRFTSISDLRQSLAMRRACSDEVDIELGELGVELAGRSFALRAHERRMAPTHFALSQLASQIGAPANYLRTLSLGLVISCLREGISKARFLARRILVTHLPTSTGLPKLRALTSPKYGRIWDEHVVSMVETLVEASGGAFKNPPDWSGTPSGLYASDRDVFLFFIDGGSVVDGGSDRDQLHRGFYVWNSEVGAAKFGFATFFLRAVCGNHLIMGAENVTEFSFRHSSGAPKRFFDEAKVALEAHVATAPHGVEDLIQSAKRALIPAKEKDEVIAWISAQGFPLETATSAYQSAEAEEGRCLTIWDAVNGLTAFAKRLKHVDARVGLERAAGRLLSPKLLRA